MVKYIKREVNDNKIEIDPIYRGHIKLALINIGYPVEDLAGYKTGEEYHFNLRNKLLSNGEDFSLREYQLFWHHQSNHNSKHYLKFFLLTVPILCFP